MYIHYRLGTMGWYYGTHWWDVQYIRDREAIRNAGWLPNESHWLVPNTFTDF